MQNKLHKSKQIIFLTLFEILFLILFNIINVYYAKDINLVVFNFRFILIMLGFNLLILTINLKNKWIIYGLTIMEMVFIFKLFTMYFTKFSNHSIIYLLLLFSFTFILFGVSKLNINLHKNIKQISEIIFYDFITGLPSKNILLKTCPIKDFKKNSKRSCLYHEKNKIFNKNQDLAVLLVDIDDFKLINDNLGSKSGNILLKQVAERLKTLVRENDTVIRYSADEFLIILYNVNSENNIEKIALRIIEKIKKPFTVLNKQVNVTCSIGLTFLPQHDNCLEILIENAGIALSEAKSSGKNKYIIFNYFLKNTFNDRFNKISGLKAALKNNDFVVHYQPKAYTATNEIYELEALIRWNHPSLGLIYPNDFIPLAEEIGIIKEIDTLVIIKACEQIKHWVSVCKSPYNITVNISPLFFMDHDFINKIDTIISEVGIDSSYLGIEITETVAINDTEKAINTINELKNRSIKVYLDDFGKGYSSLNYLKHLPIDYLKIDKSFIDGINVNRIDEEIISNIIYICSLLGIKVISEGIETLEQLDFIKAKSCFGYQGYLLSKPMLIEDLNI